MRNAQLEQALHSGEGWKVPPIPAEAFQVNAQDLDWVNRQGIVEPLATFQPRLHLTGGIECGHNVMLDLPEELTRELLAVPTLASAH